MARKYFKGYTITAAGFGIWFIGWGTYTPCFSVFLKPLIDEFGWSRADASLAYSLSFMVMAFSAIVMGWLTDRLGPKLVVMIFGSFLGLSYILLSKMSTLWHFYAAYGILAGIGSSTITVPVMATLSRWFHRKRSFIIGIVQAGMGVGGIIFAPLAGWLIVHHGWRAAYLVIGIITLIGLVTAGFFLMRDPEEAGLLPDGADKDVPGKDVRGEEDPAAPEQGREGSSLKQALRRREFWIIVGLFCTFGFCRSAFTAHITAHIQDLGFTLTDGANILAVIIGASLFGRVGMGHVADIIGNKLCFIMSFGATTVSLIIGLIATDLWMLYLFAFIFGAAWGNQAVLRFSLTSEVFGLLSVGTFMGVFGGVESFSATFGSYFGGYIFDAFKSYKLLFWSGIGISLTGTVLSALLNPAKSKR